MTVPIPSRVVPAQTITLTIPPCAGGCTVKLTIPQQSLVSQTTKTPSTTAPVKLGTITINFSCTGPDLQHLACTGVKQ